MTSLTVRSGAMPIAPSAPVLYLSDGPLSTRCALCRSKLLLDDGVLFCLLHERVRAEVKPRRPVPFVFGPERRRPIAPTTPCSAGCGGTARWGSNLKLCAPCSAARKRRQDQAYRETRKQGRIAS